MSDVEEPPAKIAKTEMTPESQELQEMDEGQEEWLSEGLLTDDDNYQAPDQDGTDSNAGNTSQEDLDETFLDETMLSGEQSVESQNVSQETQNTSQETQDTSQGISQNVSQDVTLGDVTQDQEPESQEPEEKVEAKATEPETIEQTLTNLENQPEETTVKGEEIGDVKQEETVKKEKSDGNDTDDLLRLLGDNDDKSKKKVLVKTKDKNGKSRSLKEKENESSEDDDEYIFNSSTVQKLRVAKNALIRKPATKAEPEEMSEDETECESSDEAATLKNMFAMKKPQNNKAAKSTAKPPYSSQPAKKVVKIGDTNIGFLSDKLKPKPPTVSSRTPSKPILKTIKNTSSTQVRTSTPTRTLLRTPVTKDVKEEKPMSMSEHEEIINEEEFLEEDDFDLDENFAETFDMEVEALRNRQMIMRPEQMDEEIPTDGESHSDSDGSMYDELPSSDSEGLEDWFSLDIRAERASDFLPLLGDKAYELLTQEKRRVAERLTSLRQSVAQLHCSGKTQAELLRKAAVTLSELDDMLKTA